MFVKRLKKPLFLTSDRLKLEHNGQELFSKLNSMMFLVCVLDRKYFPGTTIWGYSIGEVKLLWILSSFVKGISMQKNFDYLIYVIYSLDVFCLHITEQNVYICMCRCIYIYFCIYQNKMPSACSVMEPVSANLSETANAMVSSMH